ncbi:MAG: hypothetical protein WCR98_05760 [Saccharofermentanales bacterium]
MYYRVHRTDCPVPFDAEHAYSTPWGWQPGDTVTRQCNCGYWDKCPRCQGTGEYTEEIDLVRGFSCCESAEELIDYFEARGGCDDNQPVAIFEGDFTDSGSDNEPCVVPTKIVEWTTYAGLKRRVKTGIKI